MPYITAYRSKGQLLNVPQRVTMTEFCFLSAPHLQRIHSSLPRPQKGALPSFLAVETSGPGALKCSAPARRVAWRRDGGPGDL
jgi:hypothetical protein